MATINPEHQQGEEEDNHRDIEGQGSLFSDEQTVAPTDSAPLEPRAQNVPEEPAFPAYQSDPAPVYTPPQPHYEPHPAAPERSYRKLWVGMGAGAFVVATIGAAFWAKSEENDKSSVAVATVPQTTELPPPPLVPLPSTTESLPSTTLPPEATPNDEPIDLSPLFSDETLDVLEKYEYDVVVEDTRLEVGEVPTTDEGWSQLAVDRLQNLFILYGASNRPELEEGDRLLRTIDPFILPEDPDSWHASILHPSVNGRVYQFEETDKAIIPYFTVEEDSELIFKSGSVYPNPVIRAYFNEAPCKNVRSDVTAADGDEQEHQCTVSGQVVFDKFSGITVRHSIEFSGDLA